MTKKTLADWRTIIADLDRTKDPIITVADRHRVTVSQIAYWRRRVYEDEHDDTRPSLAMAFVEAKPVDDAVDVDATQPFVVRMASGITIAVPASFDAIALRRLLSVVNEVR